MSSRAAVFVGVLAAAIGCRNSSTREPAPAEPAATPPESNASEPAPRTAETMREHFDAVDSIKAALVDGDLVTAQREVARIVGHPVDRELAAWQPHVEQMREIGRELQRATDVRAASMAAARLGAACGSCHVALGHRPELKTAPEPAAGDPLQAEMQRHQWAADRMWEGLVAPSDELWRSGAEVLAEPSLFGDPEPTDLSIVDRLAAEVSGLAERAQTASTQKERAEIFGEALGTCGQCHRLIRPE